MAVTHRDCSAQNSIVANKMYRTLDADKLSAALCNIITISNTQDPEKSHGWLSSPASSHWPASVGQGTADLPHTNESKSDIIYISNNPFKEIFVSSTQEWILHEAHLIFHGLPKSHTQIHFPMHLHFKINLEAHKRWLMQETKPDSSIRFT